MGGREGLIDTAVKTAETGKFLYLYKNVSLCFSNNIFYKVIFKDV
jgi:hypothetical protein